MLIISMLCFVHWICSLKHCPVMRGLKILRLPASFLLYTFTEHSVQWPTPVKDGEMFNAQNEPKKPDRHHVFVDRSQIAMCQALLSTEHGANSAVDNFKVVMGQLHHFFKAEESCMKRYQYQNILSHKDSHSQLSMMLSKTVACIRLPTAESTVTALSIFMQHLLLHSDTHDKLLKDYIDEYHDEDLNMMNFLRARLSAGLTMACSIVQTRVSIPLERGLYKIMCVPNQ